MRKSVYMLVCRVEVGENVEFCEIVFRSFVCTYIIYISICMYVHTRACCVLTALDLDMAQLPIHREILQVHGTRRCNR